MLRRNGSAAPKVAVLGGGVLCVLSIGVVLFLAPCRAGHAPKAGTFDVPAGAKRICLSLRVLSNKVSKAIAAKLPLPEDCLNLAGIGFLEGFLVDDAGDGDLVLVGLQSDSRPSLRLDDLAVGTRSLDRPDGHPYCSLDPRWEDTRALQKLFRQTGQLSSPGALRAFFERLRATVGPQQVVVGGVPTNSRFAHVMVDADYHMKKVSQGIISLEGVASYLDRSLEAAGESVASGNAAAQPPVSMARFWFHVAARNPTFEEGKGIVWLDRCSVVVLTEKQTATATGGLVDAGEDDPIAEAFADELSARISAETRDVPVYADLENLFRLRALLLAADFRNSFFMAGLDSSSFLRGYACQDEKPMEESLPGLANFRERSCSVSDGDVIRKYYLVPMVSGGVGMDMALGRSSFSSGARAELASLRTAALVARPSTGSLSWVVPMVGGSLTSPRPVSP